MIRPRHSCTKTAKETDSDLPSDTNRPRRAVVPPSDSEKSRATEVLEMINKDLQATALQALSPTVIEAVNGLSDGSMHHLLNLIWEEFVELDGRPNAQGKLLLERILLSTIADSRLAEIALVLGHTSSVPK